MTPSSFFGIGEYRYRLLIQPPRAQSDYRLSPISYRLSPISYRLSPINYRPSAIAYRLSPIAYRFQALVTHPKRNTIFMHYLHIIARTTVATYRKVLYLVGSP